MTKPQIRAKIRELKVSRGQALKEGEGERATILRHQISRFKKISRRLAAA